MPGDEGSHALPAVHPHAPLGHLAHLGFALLGAETVDEIACHVLTDLAAMPGVHRVGLALSEGGGRRLRFTASDRIGDGDLNWCHIDAYDDVPLTEAVRTGEPVLGLRDGFDRRYLEFMGGQPAEVAALAAVPLAGAVGSPVGGLVVFLDETWVLDGGQRRLIEAAARRTSDALRRVRAIAPQTSALADVPGDPSAVTARIELPDDPRSAGQARRFLRSFLAEADVDDDVVSTAQLCLSELVTNAVVHAGSPMELTATLDGVLTVTVRDRGRAPIGEQGGADGDPLRVHGRGLDLVEALVDRWGADRDPSGLTVWFVLELDAEERTEERTG